MPCGIVRRRSDRSPKVRPLSDFSTRHIPADFFRVALLSAGLWKALVLKDFFEFRIPYEKGSIPEPRNWRKVYLVRSLSLFCGRH